MTSQITITDQKLTLFTPSLKVMPNTDSVFFSSPEPSSKNSGFTPTVSGVERKQSAIMTVQTRETMVTMLNE